MAYKIENLEEFKKSNYNKKIGVVYSCFDLLHSGHYLFLEFSKNNCDILCVGLQTDPTIDRPEKNKPIQTLLEREIQVKGCRYVDNYFIYSTEEELIRSLELLKPDIRFLGDDYEGKRFTGDKMPVEIKYHKRSAHSWSSSGLRKRIKEM
jgi:glycerol-3-phosphate cytidylyltransferase